MLATINCTYCSKEVEISQALTADIERQVLQAAHEKHQKELQKVRGELLLQTQLETDKAIRLARQQVAGEIEIAKKEAQNEVKIAKRQLEAESEAAKKRAISEQEIFVRSLQQDAAAEKKSNAELRTQLNELMSELRVARKAKENAEFEMQKRLAEEEHKIRESALKEADEKQRLHLAARDKTISDLQKALDEAQRKAAQGSQQLQGEIMELDFEQTLSNAFRDDSIEPIAKGVRGGDIRQVVKSPRGASCGVILYEIKRTKNWTDGWIPKLKQDSRAEKANIPVIITEVMPKQLQEDMGMFEGVWVCRPQLAIVLATLLRKALLDVGAQKALTQNRGTKADLLYSFFTSHEFVQQIESMVETYQEMTVQVTKERAAYEKLWSQREKQAQKLLLSTANIIGSMQGYVGQSSMPKIKGLELLDAATEL